VVRPRQRVVSDERRSQLGQWGVPSAAERFKHESVGVWGTKVRVIYFYVSPCVAEGTLPEKHGSVLRAMKLSATILCLDDVKIRVCTAFEAYTTLRL